MQFSTKLEGVPASDVGDVIDELEAGVRALHLGPVKAAQFLRKNIVGKNADAGEAAVERIGYSRIQSVLGLDVGGVVAGESGLVKPVVSKTSLIHPAGGGDIGPVFAKNLGTRVNLSQPSSLQLAGIGNRAGIVAEEIHATERIALIQVVIHFPDCIVGTHGIGEAEVDGVTRNGAGIEGEAAAVAGHGVGCRK